MTDLPIHAVLPDLLAALRSASNAVLVAPPGAGKTTAVAPALLTESWCTGEILLLSPRRLAARAAAERMAALAGEPVGKTFGYATRMDSRRSAQTRVTVVTEGIFVNRIQADPELAGVSAVLFDEVHERSLDGDFGLALALDAQAALRPDLRLVAMSATLDGARFSALMGESPVIESEGRSHPLELRHLGRAAEARIEESVAGAIRQALRETDGGILAFLPGVAEIERTAERIGDVPGIALHRLHGSLDPAAQRAAIAPDREGRRKIVLATSIAETSLTLDGIRVVVDSGLARRPRYDRAAGMTRLVTERASQAAVTQRAGRAARQGPGFAYRLWEAAATAGLPRFDPPEILEADLSALTLDCALWGVTDPRALNWLDPPPEAAVQEARARLAALEALDADGRPTPHGKAIAQLPLPPRLGHMLVRAGELGLAQTAAQIAVLLGERGLGGPDADLEHRLRRWKTERGQRAENARRLAGRWTRLVPGTRAAAIEPGSPEAVAACVALAFPDRIAKRRDASGETWVSAGGRGFRLDPASSLARHEWLAVAETQGMAAGARILSATPIDAASVETLFGHRIETRRHVRFVPASGRVEATRERRLGAIRLSSGPDTAADPDEIAAALLEGVRQHGLDLLPWSANARALRIRAAYAGLESLSDDALRADLDDWLAPALAGKRRLDAIVPEALTQALQNRLGWDGQKQLDRLAPARLETPAGSSHEIDYAAEGGPMVEVRVQALFGLATHPMLGDGTPLVLSLTSPAGRPIQTTRDLPGFWKGSWADVAKEMRGRYPRHPWPDDPAAANPTLRTKNADARRSGSR
ncbi:ATP-dependent helicase HrpB [Sphingomonas koreensis]|uniref:ATP-dependent helicase HrpB n=1 Tax=Sphingomonas koreensis TaxID=93064 RepID=A0A1L6J6P9_9SPHN|nr:ATP-dependent helicase HrpB [Sphingomonas koreensis]APR51589.1 ATP-dependent helicase HrpB [Sphingomonas koreensis]MDC7811745.1 ATP-dependent helicase HrpB [Sphingomonas koreensis]RSU18918.1 ATP-dependent helicase HrpB [Sphingomonas koreensis]RSU19910.1 ATP-dependent helicase HrpB [Sphingomonas koreensis]RSU21164.1 ATP-dependent helicase HrpB [Sphingomonas koreensis]